MRNYKEYLEGVLFRVKADYMGDNSYHKRVMMDTIQNLYDAFQEAEKRKESKETKIINAKESIEEVIKTWDNTDKAMKNGALLTIADNFQVLREQMEGSDVVGFVENILQHYTLELPLYAFMLSLRDSFLK